MRVIVEILELHTIHAYVNTSGVLLQLCCENFKDSIRRPHELQPAEEGVKSCQIRYLTYLHRNVARNQFLC